MVSKAKIKLYRGDDETRKVVLKTQTDIGLIGLNLADVARIDLQARTDETLVLNLSTENGGIEFLERENGAILLNFTHEQTAKADWESAEYDLQLIYSNGKIKTVLSGEIQLIHDVTKVEG